MVCVVLGAELCGEFVDFFALDRVEFVEEILNVERHQHYPFAMSWLRCLSKRSSAFRMRPL